MKTPCFLFTACIFLALMFTHSCSGAAIKKNYSGTFTDDRDGKSYKTIGIGTQIWMAENLNYETEGSVCYENSDSNCDTYIYMKKTMKAVLMPLIAFAICAQAQTQIFTDSRDGKNYKTVKIGSQIWMVENLNYETEGSVCYENSDSNCDTYGRLYNWETAMKACPYGWHLPSHSEWQALVNFAGGMDAAGGKLKAKSGWDERGGSSGKGTDCFGFSALPGGCGYDGFFDFAGDWGGWWSTREDDSYIAYIRSMYYNDYSAYWDYRDKRGLFSVRCVQD